MFDTATITNKYHNRQLTFETPDNVWYLVYVHGHQVAHLRSMYMYRFLLRYGVCPMKVLLKLVC